MLNDWILLSLSENCDLIRLVFYENLHISSVVSHITIIHVSNNLFTRGSLKAGAEMNKKEEAQLIHRFYANEGGDNSFVPRSYPMDSASYRTIRNELSLRIRNGSLFRYLPPQRRLARNGLGRKLFGGSSLWYRNSWGWRNASRDFLVAFYARRLPSSAAKGFSLGNFGPLTNLSNVISFPLGETTR